MTKTFTQNDLVRLLYHETTEEEALEINRVLASDPELQRQYRELLLAHSSLDKARIEPSARAVENIMNHVHGLHVKQ